MNILDRFHIMKKFGEALDKVRAEEARQLNEDGDEEILKYNLKTVKAYLMREDFNRFWTYQSATWAGKFLRAWCSRARQSQIEPMQKMAATLTKHEPLLLN